jgi:hypothetical protein
MQSNSNWIQTNLPCAEQYVDGVLQQQEHKACPLCAIACSAAQFADLPAVQQHVGRTLKGLQVFRTVFGYIYGITLPVLTAVLCVLCCMQGAAMAATPSTPTASPTAMTSAGCRKSWTQTSGGLCAC